MVRRFDDDRSIFNPDSIFFPYFPVRQGNARAPPAAPRSGSSVPGVVRASKAAPGSTSQSFGGAAKARAQEPWEMCEYRSPASGARCLAHQFASSAITYANFVNEALGR